MTDYLGKFSLTGKTAFVFGGAGLLGREIAAALAQAQAQVLILDLKRSGGAGIARKLRGEGLDAQFVEFDVSAIADLDRALVSLCRSHGPVEIVVNASYPRTGDWGKRCEDVKTSSFNRNLEIQLSSSFAISRTMAEHMANSESGGSIINIGSIYGVVGNDFSIYEGTGLTSPIAYSAIKGGLTNMTRYLASYYGGHGIRFNTLCPGGIEDNQPRKFIKQYSARTPLKRMGEPHEVASAALFLASEASSYVTGTAFMVDGGWTAI